MADNPLARLMGGSPAWVIIQLVLLSIVVGVILNVLGLDPANILDSIERLLRSLFHFGFDSIERLWRYFLLGAVIVVPFWLILRLVRGGR